MCYQLLSFLGMINFYRRFIWGAASILKPLTDAKKGSGHRHRKLDWQPDKEQVWCNVSTGMWRPVVPKEFRQQVLTAIHGLGYPGVHATMRPVSNRFMWPLAGDMEQAVYGLLQGQGDPHGSLWC